MTVNILPQRTLKNNPHAAPIGQYVTTISADELKSRAPHHALAPEFRARVADVLHNYKFTVPNIPPADGVRVKVENPRDGEVYTIHLDFMNRNHTCQCGYFQAHKKDCKHMFAAARKLFPTGRECQNCGEATKPHIVDVPASAQFGATTQEGQRCVICGGKEGRF